MQHSIVCFYNYNIGSLIYYANVYNVSSIKFCQKEESLIPTLSPLALLWNLASYYIFLMDWIYSIEILNYYDTCKCCNICNYTKVQLQKSLNIISNQMYETWIVKERRYKHWNVVKLPIFVRSQQIIFSLVQQSKIFTVEICNQINISLS